MMLCKRSLELISGLTEGRKKLRTVQPDDQAFLLPTRQSDLWMIHGGTLGLADCVRAGNTLLICAVSLSRMALNEQGRRTRGAFRSRLRREEMEFR